MNVLEARGLTHSVRVQHRVEWEREHSKYMEQKQKEEDAIWETRSPILIAKIELAIRNGCARGDNHVWEPNTANPNGSEIIYIGKGDYPIHERLMEYFRSLGFTVQEYMYGGMKITW